MTTTEERGAGAPCLPPTDSAVRASRPRSVEELGQRGQHGATMLGQVEMPPGEDLEGERAGGVRAPVLGLLDRYPGVGVAGEGEDRAAQRRAVLIGVGLGGVV